MLRLHPLPPHLRQQPASLLLSFFFSSSSLFCLLLCLIFTSCVVIRRLLPACVQPLLPCFVVACLPLQLRVSFSAARLLPTPTPTFLLVGISQHLFICCAVSSIAHFCIFTSTHHSHNMSDAPAPGASPAVIDDSTIATSTAESTSTCDQTSTSAASPEAATPSGPAKPSILPSLPGLPKSIKSIKSPSIPPAAVKTAAHLDAFIVRLNKCLQTPSGIDAVLAIVCYTARLGSVLLNTAAGRALLHEPVYRLAVIFASRPSIRSILVQTSGPSSLKTDAATAALVLAKRMRALGTLLTEARMMLRLWGLVSMYVWARSLLKQLLAKQITAAKTQDAEKNGEDGDAVAKADEPSTVETLIGWTQLLTCIGYQVTENYAYLSSKGVLGASPAKQSSLYIWSSRSFSVYVAVELARGAYNIVHHGVSDTPAKKAAAIELHRNFARYASLAPVMGHWSLEKGFMNEAGLTVCGFIPAALQIHKIWQDA